MDKVLKAVEEGNYEVVRELSPREILHFDAIGCDIRGTEDAFRVAFNYFMNKKSDVTERLEAFYETLSGKSRYDQLRGTMGVTSVEGKVCLVKVIEE